MKKAIRFISLVVLTSILSSAVVIMVLRGGVLGKGDATEQSASSGLFGSEGESSRWGYHSGEVSDFTEAAERSVDAVVHVRTAYQQQSLFNNPWFEFFFGRSPQREVPMQMASGSGVIISSDGYIVTNYHVISKAQYIEVALNDKREYRAEIVGYDPNTDIALLKIEADSLKAITMGNSDDVHIGEWVLAIGNPFNLTSTVTAGIVSAKARNINILNTAMKIESFIQTDAAVNPGNSGGALVNRKGELIGINTAIASQTGSYTGYSFAIPTAIVNKVVNDIKEYGVVQRAVLGAQIQEITPDLQRRYNLATLNGAYINYVLPNSPAQRANLEVGDIITKIDGTAIKTVTELQERIGRHNPGDVVELHIIRGGREFKQEVELTNQQTITNTIN